MVFSKRLHWNLIFLVLSGKVAFFPREHEFSPLDRKGKMIFPTWCYPTKIRSTVIDILDWHCRKCFNNSLYFYGDLWSKKTPRNLIYRIELWLSLQIIRLEIFYKEESLILCFIQLSEVVFRGLLERQSRKLFVDKEMVIIPKIEKRRWKLFNAEVDQTFLKVHAKNLVKVTRTREVMGRKRPPTLRKLSAIKMVLLKHVILIMRIINIIINMDKIRQERYNKGLNLKLN